MQHTCRDTHTHTHTWIYVPGFKENFDELILRNEAPWTSNTIFEECSDSEVINKYEAPRVSNPIYEECSSSGVIYRNEAAGVSNPISISVGTVEF